MMPFVDGEKLIRAMKSFPCLWVGIKYTILLFMETHDSYPQSKAIKPMCILKTDIFTPVINFRQCCSVCCKANINSMQELVEVVVGCIT